jgi:hypothetical protein
LVDFHPASVNRNPPAVQLARPAGCIFISMTAMSLRDGRAN